MINSIPNTKQQYFSFCASLSQLLSNNCQHNANTNCNYKQSISRRNQSTIFDEAKADKISIANLKSNKKRLSTNNTSRISDSSRIETDRYQNEVLRMSQTQKSFNPDLLNITSFNLSNSNKKFSWKVY